MAEGQRLLRLRQSAKAVGYSVAWRWGGAHIFAKETAAVFVVAISPPGKTAKKNWGFCFSFSFALNFAKMHQFCLNFSSFLVCFCQKANICLKLALLLKPPHARLLTRTFRSPRQRPFGLRQNGHLPLQCVCSNH